MRKSRMILLVILVIWSLSGCGDKKHEILSAEGVSQQTTSMDVIEGQESGQIAQETLTVPNEVALEGDNAVALEGDNEAALEEDNEAAPQEDDWLTAKDILTEDGDMSAGVHTGVDVRTFIAYNGAFYGATDCQEHNQYYRSAGDFVYYNEQYKTDTYIVKDEPDLIAVVINGGLQEYQKIFDCTFDIDSVTYGITYECLMEVAYSCGAIIQEGKDFTVYQAIKLQGEPSGTQEYIVDVLPTLQRVLPNFFSDDEANYADAWWIARPLTVYK